MERVTAERVKQTKRELLDAAREVLTKDGFSGLSTRRVAEVAGTQMSQIQYHFGSKEGMILALFEHMNSALIERQNLMFEKTDLSVAQKWSLACDYLEEDLSSGYVRVFQELIAAGWSNPRICDSVRVALGQWHSLLAGLAREAEQEYGTLGPFTPEGLAALVAATFIGAESLILLGYEEQIFPMREALRQIGDVMASLENQSGTE
jgi:AcrR family transcriptional regulator